MNSVTFGDRLLYKQRPYELLGLSLQQDLGCRLSFFVHPGLCSTEA